ncbi:MAG: AMP-binding protein [Deltaproteobacteria bacterium]|nr:AMP-binding protein [Deltaproteobacteria bacterium]
MEYRWYKVWPSWVPKTFTVDKPTSEYIREWAALTPERIALTFYGRDITYQELNRTIDAIAWGLVDLGVKKGDRVALHMENCPQFVMAYFGIQRAGAIVVPVNPMFKQAELEHELNDAGAQTLIGLDALYPEVEKVRSRTPLKKVILTSLKDYLPEKPLLPLPPEAGLAGRSFPDTLAFETFIRQSKDEPLCQVTDLKKELAVLQYTGGTTGTPKGAMISHYALASASFVSLHWYHHREDDIFLGVAPFFHVMGQINLMCTPLAAGARVVILARFVPEVVAQAISRYRCTYWVGATTMVIALLNLPNVEDYDFSSFRCLWTGGAPISVELQKKLKALMPNTVIGEGYGLTETMSSGGTCTPLFRYKPGFVGIPGSNNVLQIVDRETGTKELGPNEEGEVIIKAGSMMEGYWNKPEETSQVLKDGWLHTGDIGLMDEEGYLKLLGRSREMIKCSGFSVFPAEVEDLLYKHPAVKEAAVIGVNDPYRGETPKAFIILKEGYAGKITEAEILSWCKDNMSAYKRPRAIEFKQELPKSAAGKILRRMLVEEEKKG